MEYMKKMVLMAEDEEDAQYQEEVFLDYHVVVMASFPEPYDPKRKYDFSKENFKGELMGAVVFEYYAQANAGLLTYLLVDGKWRGLSIGTILSDKCRETMEAHAKSRGHLAGCNAIFLETNSAVKVSSERPDTMEPSLRHKIFYGMGLRLVDFDYVQPPLDTDKNKVNYLLLCCFITPRIPSIRIGNKDQYYLPTHLVKNTMHAFWVNAPMKGRKFNEDVDYKRMQDQLRRRERILLLDLPWERPFTIVDLAEHFDLELLVQFYQDLLVPAYAGRLEELDSLDSWLSLLSPKHKGQTDDDIVFHLLLALKYSDDEEENSKPVIAGGLALEYFPGNNCGFLNYLLAPIGASGERMARALIDRAIADLDNDAKTRGQLGGCNVIFMECSQTTSGTTVAVPQVTRVTPSAPSHKQLLPSPSSSSFSTGPSSSNSSSSASSSASSASSSSTTTTAIVSHTPSTSTGAIHELATEVRDIDEQHPLLESMGWKLVDFDYIQPPNIVPPKKVKSMLLIALVTPRIPVLSQEGRSQPYLPSTTLKKFMSELWDQFCDRISYDYTNDADFIEMIEKIDRRPRIPLLPRPWNKPWTMVDLQETNNPQLLKQFYEEMLKPTFKEELEPIDTWQRRLTRNRTGAHFHVLVAMKPTLEGSGSETATLLGGLAFEYLEGTNCGFITHVLIKDKPHREMVAKSLMERAVEILDQDAVVRGSLAGCNAIFLETGEKDESSKSLATSTSSSSQVLITLPSPSSSSSPSSEDSTTSSISGLDISSHHQLLHRLGWRLVDFGYVAPQPRGKEMRKPRVHKSLAMFLTQRVPHAEVPTNEDYYYLPRHTLTSFINEYWRLALLHSGIDYKKDPHFKNMMDLGTRRESVPLLDLPWTRPWSLVDLWEDFDAQLLYKFYQNSYATQFPDRADREPLSTWLQLLSDESRDSLSVEDFHVLLAIEYPMLSGSGTSTATKTTTTNILGGLIFTYYPATSCGLLSYMTMNAGDSNRELMARSLLDEAAVNLHENAALRGHIAGCNAIFMEAPLSNPPGSVRPDWDTLHKGGWRMLSFDYWRPPLSIFSAGATPSMLLVLLTSNVPKQTINGQETHYIPRAMVRSFLLHHWRNYFHRIGRTQIARDPCYQSMMQSLEGLEFVTLRDLPWGVPQVKL
jgi:GNAT superfamily N-acetyltransferase